MAEQEATNLATRLNQKTTSSGSTGMYAVVRVAKGPNGFTVQTSAQAAQEHAGLGSQASAEYSAKSNAVAQAVCAVPAVVVALTVGDTSHSATSNGLNNLASGAGVAQKVLQVAEAAPNGAVSAMAEGLAKPVPLAAIALAVPASVNNQRACVSDQTKDYTNRSSTVAQREQ